MVNNAQVTQAERLAALFRANPNEWIPLPRILGLGIAQYNSRIWYLRRKGMQIENRTQYERDIKHSWYKYMPPDPKCHCDYCEKCLNMGGGEGNVSSER